MSMYSMLDPRLSPAVFYVVPMLNKHPDEFPRFRDCFIGDDHYPEYDDYIHIYTRVGSLNQNFTFGEDALYKDKYYVTFLDDMEDRTYGTYVFRVPEKWKDDFEKFKQRKVKEFSNEYKKQLYEIFPKLKDKFDELFKEKKENIKNVRRHD